MDLGAGAGYRQQSWDVFCRVVDNYGDAAVSWRLARQLVQEHGLAVRLWVDRPEVLRALCPEFSGNAASQLVDGVDVRRWDATTETAADTVVADVVIEAFGCGLPDGYVAAMAARRQRSLWITLEYLSAESWVATHHGMPSPHPRLPLDRFFFFPGFGPGTGGLLKEAGLDGRRMDFQGNPERRAQLWRNLGHAPPPAAARLVSLFGYENAPVEALLEAWSAGADQIVAAVPQSPLHPRIAASLGAEGARDGDVIRRGNLEVRLMAFLSQRQYDELLWCCDWNFVRGEDSFVRAQWAARPMVWHIYPQSEGAHKVKLEAFLARYTEGLDRNLSESLRILWRGWNGGREPMAGAWDRLVRHGDDLARHAAAWAIQVSGAGDLARNLVHFCQSKVK